MFAGGFWHGRAGRHTCPSGSGRTCGCPDSRTHASPARLHPGGPREGPSSAPSTAMSSACSCQVTGASQQTSGGAHRPLPPPAGLDALSPHVPAAQPRANHTATLGFRERVPSGSRSPTPPRGAALPCAAGSTW